jgi:hypothetical protein
MTIQHFVIEHTSRGECSCGKCFDVGNKSDLVGHTADMVFFKVAAIGNPSVEEFRRLTAENRGEFSQCNPFDGKEHNYLELGAWIGDQGIAMQYMALGSLLGVFKLLTPITMLKLPANDLLVNLLVKQMAGMGMISVQAVT